MDTDNYKAKYESITNKFLEYLTIHGYEKKLLALGGSCDRTIDYSNYCIENSPYGGNHKISPLLNIFIIYKKNSGCYYYICFGNTYLDNDQMINSGKLLNLDNLINDVEEHLLSINRSRIINIKRIF